MHFAIINPAKQETTVVDCVSDRDAYLMAGLKPGQIDFGLVTPSMGIVVYEYSLFVPAEKQSYFAINTRLYAGPAVLYGINKGGDTVSLPGVPPIVFMQNASAVERNIALGLIGRPQLAANGVVIWEWPQPQPPSTKRNP